MCDPTCALISLDGLVMLVITDADDSRVSIAISRVCASVCDSVCPHYKTKTAESTITNLRTEIVHDGTSPINEY